MPIGSALNAEKNKRPTLVKHFKTEQSHWTAISSGNNF